MTVSDAIDRAEGIYKYGGGYKRLIEWLSELEEKISIELFHTEKENKLTIKSELTAPDAYAELYPLYLVMKATFAEGRSDKYNDYARFFNRAYSEYIDYVNRARKTEKTVYYTIL